MIRWNFTPMTPRTSAPVINDDEALVVVPRETGGFALRFSDSVTLIGNFPTPKAAEDYARTQVTNVRVLHLNTTVAHKPATPDDKMLNLLRQ